MLPMAQKPESEGRPPRPWVEIQDPPAAAQASAVSGTSASLHSDSRHHRSFQMPPPARQRRAASSKAARLGLQQSAAGPGSATAGRSTGRTARERATNRSFQRRGALPPQQGAEPRPRDMPPRFALAAGDTILLQCPVGHDPEIRTAAGRRDKTANSREGRGCCRPIPSRRTRTKVRTVRQGISPGRSPWGAAGP